MAHDDERPRSWFPGIGSSNSDYWRPQNDPSSPDDVAKPVIKGIESPEQRKRRLERESKLGNWSYDKLAGGLASSKPTDDPSDAVGYGKPPKNTRFKPGMSGNPSGRPKRTLNLSNQLYALMNKSIKVTDKATGQEKKMLNAEIIAHQLVAKAKQGDIKAIDRIHKELQNHPAMTLAHNVDCRADREKKEAFNKLIDRMQDLAKRAWRYRDIERLLPAQDPVEILRYLPEVQDAQYRQSRGLPSRKAGDPMLIPPDQIKKPEEPLD